MTKEGLSDINGLANRFSEGNILDCKAKPTLNGARSPKSPTIWKYIYHMRPARFESQIALTELKRAPLHTGWSHKKEGTKKARWDFKNISSQFFLEEIQAKYF